MDAGTDSVQGRSGRVIGREPRAHAAALPTRTEERECPRIASGECESFAVCFLFFFFSLFSQSLISESEGGTTVGGTIIH